MSSRRIGESSAGPGLGQEFETTYEPEQLPENQDQGISDQRGERIRSSEISSEEDHPTGGNTFSHLEVKPQSRRPVSQKLYDSNISETRTTTAYTSLQSELDPGASVELQDLSAPRPYSLGGGEEQLTPNPSPAQSSQRGLITTFLLQMRAALLRSSPAEGVSSYGAIPTIPIDSDSSSLEGERVSDEDEVDDHVCQGQDRLYGERDEECMVGAKSEMRKRNGVMGAEMLGPSRALGDGLGESLGIGRGPGLGGPEVAEEGEQYDENDPPDNSPYVNPLQ